MNRDDQLTKAYKKSFKNIIKAESDSSTLGLLFFTEHLKYLRDHLLLKNIHDIEHEPIKTNLATLNTALAEFEAYFKATESDQKKFHWTNFCDFVKLNMEEWLELNDSI